jgi:hypothetical protein
VRRAARNGLARADIWSGGVSRAIRPSKGDPVGPLAGSASDPELVWLTSSTGGRISLIWPAGYRVAFEPDAAIYITISRSDPPLVAELARLYGADASAVRIRPR